jgi:hypothetical protein
MDDMTAFKEVFKVPEGEKTSRAAAPPISVMNSRRF